MNKILIVVDMQNDFVDASLGTKEAEAIVDNVVKKINEFEGDIFVTMDTHFNNYMETSEGKNLPVPHCIKGTYGWQLNSKVKEALDKKKYLVVEKLTFGSIALPRLITNEFGLGELDIELIGLCTDICVVSNALLLKANFPEATMTVDASCCAGVTVEKHKSALEIMKSCQIKVVNE